MDAPARILLVDDNPFDRELAILTLRGLATPFTIREAASWEEARGLVDGEGIDLLLLDLSLPGMDGIAVLRELAGHGRRPPVVVLSGYDDHETVSAARAAGADDYVVKTLDWGEPLCRAVERALARVTPPVGPA